MWGIGRILACCAMKQIGKTRRLWCVALPSLLQRPHYFVVMGNSTSISKDSETCFSSQKISRKQLRTLFRKYTKDSFNNVELITISHFLFGKIVELHTEIQYDDLIDKLGLNNIRETTSYNLLYSFLKRLSRWPYIFNFKETETTSSFTLYDILVLIFFLNKQGLKAMGLDDSHYASKLYFSIFLINLTGEDSSDVDVIFNQKNNIQWNLLPIVKSFDYIEFDFIDNTAIANVLQFLLPLSVVNINDQSFKLSYKAQIRSLVNTMNMLCERQPFELNEMANRVNCFAPRMFDSLENIFINVMQPEEIEAKEMSNQSTVETDFNHKILNLQVLSQLSTIISIKKISSMQTSRALYQGSKHGFSINSMQSHILNYNAKTLLLISGKTRSKTEIQSTFYDKFPTFHPVLDSSADLKENTKFQMAIIVPTPWKITNTKTFGNRELKMIQLSPYQIECSALQSIKQDYCYFSNIGLGLGFGSLPPQRSKDSKKHNNTFRLGGVSLTIDTFLEVGNFRIEDPNKQSSSLLLNDKQTPNIYNDIWFKINELEIYGLGNEETLEKQKRALAWEEKEAERQRGLGNKGYMEGRALLELAGIIGGSSSGGSV